MRILSKLLVFPVVFLTCLALFASSANAEPGEGEFLLRSTTSDSHKCYVVSLIDSQANFNVLVRCQNLVYPIEGEDVAYVLWGNPIGGGKVQKLTQLGFGRMAVQTKIPFSSLFVTLEPTTRVDIPSGKVVMQGGLQAIEFIEEDTTPTPTIEGEEAEEITPTATERSTGEKLSIALRRAGYVGIFAIIALMGLIFVITRPRG